MADAAAAAAVMECVCVNMSMSLPHNLVKVGVWGETLNTVQEMNVWAVYH